LFDRNKTTNTHTPAPHVPIQDLSLCSSSCWMHEFSHKERRQHQKQPDFVEMSGFVEVTSDDRIADLNHLIVDKNLNHHADHPLGMAIPNPGLHQPPPTVRAVASTTTAHVPKRQTKRRDTIKRRGKWTPEEENYAKRVIEEFQDGLLPLADGTTLRTFLSKLLNCEPMRISKKFVGDSGIGKQVFRRRSDLDSLSMDEIMRRRTELCELEKKFLDTLAQTSHPNKPARMTQTQCVVHERYSAPILQSSEQYQCAIDSIPDGNLQLGHELADPARWMDFNHDTYPQNDESNSNMSGRKRGRDDMMLEAF